MERFISVSKVLDGYDSYVSCDITNAFNIEEDLSIKVQNIVGTKNKTTQWVAVFVVSDDS